ncbi:cation transporter [Streptococcus sp. H49]|uniref:cation transporter n=1 Tax=Streptococcus huangxiaojuni TaxID=3237239 RepID=UPI0034A33712
MNLKKIEQKSLWVGILINIAMGAIGLVIYRITRIEALFLDAYYTIIAVVSCLVAITISKVSTKRTLLFPNGFFIFEPLYAFLKSSLSLILLMISSITVTKNAYLYFFRGEGKLLAAAPVVFYGLIMAAISLLLSFYYRRQNKKIGQVSTMLLSETKTSLVDSAISAGIGIGAFLILWIDEQSPLGFLKYTGDFFITIGLVFFTIKEPIRLIKKALVELTGGRLIKGTTLHHIESLVQPQLSEKDFIQDCIVYKVGMSFQIHLKLNREMKTVYMTELEDKRQAMLQTLKPFYAFVDINYIY